MTNTNVRPCVQVQQHVYCHNESLESYERIDGRLTLCGGGVEEVGLGRIRHRVVPRVRHRSVGGDGVGGAHHERCRRGVRRRVQHQRAVREQLIRF